MRTPAQARKKYCAEACYNAARRESAISNNDYLRVKVDGEMVGEHRHVVEQAIGRKLTEDESVHHLNGKRWDNRLENLELWSTRAHRPGQRVEDWIKDAIWTLERYAPHLLNPTPADSAQNPILVLAGSNIPPSQQIEKLRLVPSESSLPQLQSESPTSKAA
jgi:hypothetical protein